MACRRDQPRPWLILGKGPTFHSRHRFDLRSYETLGLNHVCRETAVTVAHAIDLDVVEQCGDAIARNAQVLVMPWRPHVRSGRSRAWRTGCPTTLSNLTVEQLAAQHPMLRRLDEEGRLLWYNLSTAGSAVRGGSPIVLVRYFSAEAALNLLATAGVRHVRSLGVDGGTEYSPEFADLADTTRLVNGRDDFDVQFGEIARTLLRTGISYAPLDIDRPMQVYVAGSEPQMLPLRVLEYSIRKHASLDVAVHAIDDAGAPIPLPKDACNRPRTPFSFQRFLVPALSGFQGRAIYLDSDMQVFKDIRRLWTLPFAGADVLAAPASATSRLPQFSVMVLNCARLRWDIHTIVDALDTGRLTYEQLMHKLAITGRVRVDVPPEWNSLEAFHPQKTALLHYTDMSTQPWLSKANRLGFLWTRDLFDALDAGFIPAHEVESHIRAGHVRPSLLYQIEHRIDDSYRLPRAAARLDARFAPSSVDVNRSRGGAWRRWARLARIAPFRAITGGPLRTKGAHRDQPA